MNNNSKDMNIFFGVHVISELEIIKVNTPFLGKDDFTYSKVILPLEKQILLHLVNYAMGWHLTNLPQSFFDKFMHFVLPLFNHVDSILRLEAENKFNFIFGKPIGYQLFVGGFVAFCQKFIDDEKKMLKGENQCK